MRTTPRANRFWENPPSTKPGAIQSETGEALPLLQIVPSKTDRERVLLISPELTHILAQVRKRVSDADGRVPLTVRYDGAERVYSDPCRTCSRHGTVVSGER